MQITQEKHLIVCFCAFGERQEDRDRERERERERYFRTELRVSSSELCISFPSIFCSGTSSRNNL